MRIFNEGTLRTWAQTHPSSKAGLVAWKAVVEGAVWENPNEMLDDLTCDLVKGISPSAGLTPGDVRVIFDVSGNKFRLVAHVKFARKNVFLKWFGTHAQYDKLDLQKMKLS